MSISNFNFTKLLSQDDLRYLENNIRPIELAKNTILFYQDNICKDILLLEQGEVSLYIYGRTKNELISLYSIGDGEQCIINTASAISQTKAIANAVAITDIKAYLLSFSAAKKMMHMNQEYQDFIFSLFSVKLGSLISLIDDTKFKKLDARILAQLTAKNENTINITHEQLAQSLSTSRVVVSRILKELEHKKKIKLHHGYIEMLK